MIVCYTCTINNEEAAEGNVDETEENDNTEQDEQFVDTVECKKRLKEAYETILMYEVPLDDLDRKLHRRIRMRLAGFCAELNKSKEGDTVPTIFKKTEARPKVDLRIMSILNSKEGDYSLGEFSKIAESTKLYEDKLKLALMAKFHLNSLIKNNTDCIYPFIMIMGFEFVFLTMEFIEGVGYIINQIDQCCFPITKKAINCGGTQALINCINTVKNFVSSMKDRKEDGKREKTVNKIKQLVGEKKEEKTKQNTTAVFWPKTKDGLFLVEAAAKSEDDVGECVSGGETEDEEDDEDE
ncbi:hypothetical protein G6F47_011420 [Rhizopus delemar]|nr:hypothetical protein G6F47_011420 [Rhizopus delemar]